MWNMKFREKKKLNYKTQNKWPKKKENKNAMEYRKTQQQEIHGMPPLPPPLKEMAVELKIERTEICANLCKVPEKNILFNPWLYVTIRKTMCLHVWCKSAQILLQMYMHVCVGVLHLMGRLRKVLRTKRMWARKIYDVWNFWFEK